MSETKQYKITLIVTIPTNTYEDAIDWAEYLANVLRDRGLLGSYDGINATIEVVK